MRRLGLFVVALVIGVAGALAPAARAAPENRVALVIGNGAYESVGALKNPVADARLMAGTLRQLGFALVGGGAQLNLSRAAMEAAIGRFRGAIGPGTVAFFYYSGHGVQVEGSNYLVPVNAAPATQRDVPLQMVAADLVLQDMADAGAALNIMVLDACRNNPFVDAGQAGGRGLRPAGPAGANTAPAAGLAEMHAPRATLISFATQPGSVAFDGGPGMQDSPYTTALAASLRRPGLDIVRAFNRAGIEVGHLTGEQQEPWLAISPIEDEVFLAGPPGTAAGAAALQAPATAPAMIQPPDFRPAMTEARTPQAAALPGAPAGAPTPACPRAGTRAVRDNGVSVLYQGVQPGTTDVCLADIGGISDPRVLGIWPAAWPGAAAAASAMRKVLAEPKGSRASFIVTEDVNGLRDTITSEGWQFTLTNEGSAMRKVSGMVRPTARVLWQERSLSHAYQAQADIEVDLRTGAVLSQNFRAVVGGSAASYEFWSRYQGGLASVPNFSVTALR